MQERSNSTTIKNQCEQIGWPIQTLQAKYLGKKLWHYEGATYTTPEELVLAYLKPKVIDCSWCEGGSINLLIKACALDILAKLNLFHDREDAISRYLEAQFTILNEHKKDILTSIQNISFSKLKQNIYEIAANKFIREFYPNVTEKFLLSLSENVDLNLISKIAELFFNDPYKYRAGWPDITIIKNNNISFVEVKTTDLLHESQLRFALEIAKPLTLDCKVIQLTNLTQ